jgi:hypothetical protein
MPTGHDPPGLADCPTRGRAPISRGASPSPFAGFRSSGRFLRALRLGPAQQNSAPFAGLFPFCRTFSSRPVDGPAQRNWASFAGLCPFYRTFSSHYPVWSCTTETGAVRGPLSVLQDIFLAPCGLVLHNGIRRRLWAPVLRDGFFASCGLVLHNGSLRKARVVPCSTGSWWGARPAGETHAIRDLPENAPKARENGAFLGETRAQYARRPGRAKRRRPMRRRRGAYARRQNRAAPTPGDRTRSAYARRQKVRPSIVQDWTSASPRSSAIRVSGFSPISAQGKKALSPPRASTSWPT